MAKTLESKKRYVFDLESDNLLVDATKIHCLSIKDIDTGGMFHYPPDKIKIGLLRLYNAKVLIAHNQINYDLQLIKKLFPLWETKARIYDTLLLSQLFWPDIGLHSLGAWGERLGVAKPVHEDWSVYSKAMRVRCNEDVRINFLLWLKCEREIASHKWDDSILLENNVMEVHNKQLVNGVHFERDKARNLLGTLIKEIELVDMSIKPVLSVRCQKLNQGKEVPLIFKKDGTYRQNIVNYFGEDYVASVKAPFSRVSFPRISLGSVQQVKNFLFRLGWKPDSWNYKKIDRRLIRTSPKITESSLESIGHTEFGRLYLRRIMLRHRKNFLSSDKNSGLLHNLRGDGRIVSNAITIGTNTGRYRHSTIVNVPGAYAPYGKEMRSLFSVPLFHYFLGVDLDGIEARILCHYCYNFKGGKEFAELVLDGDFHQANADMWRVSRNVAKSILYAMMYSAGDLKLGQLAGGDAKLGKKMKADFMASNPAYASLLDGLDKLYKRDGYLTGIDGRKISIRHKHKLLNSLIQSAGSIIAKYWMVKVDALLSNENVKQLIFMHDEINYEVQGDLGYVNQIKSIVERGAVETGRYFNMNVKIEATGLVGQSWYECH